MDVISDVNGTYYFNKNIYVYIRSNQKNIRLIKRIKNYSYRNRTGKEIILALTNSNEFWLLSNKSQYTYIQFSWVKE